MLLFGSVLVSSYCLTGLGPAQLRDLARHVGRGGAADRSLGNGEASHRDLEEGPELSSEIYWRPYSPSQCFALDLQISCATTLCFPEHGRGWSPQQGLKE